MKEQLQKIDILRGLAILLVFGYHCLLIIFGPYHITEYNGLWVNMAATTGKHLFLSLNPIGQGSMGVSLFLFISGFLIHWGYLKANSTFEPLKFYNKRFWRIYPPYLFAILVFLAILGLPSKLNLLTHFTLTHNFSEQTVFGINPSFWSLALEMQLYLLYPLYLLLHRYLGLGKSVIVIAVFSLATTAMGVLTERHLPGSAFNFWIVWVLGAYLGENFYYKKRLYHGNPWYLVVAYGCFLCLPLTPVSAYVGQFLFALLCVYAVDWYLHTEKTLLFSSLKVNNMLGLVGLYSYSIYLFHQPVLLNLLPIFSFNFANTYACIMGAFILFMLVLGFSRLTYHWLELPSIALGNKFYAKFHKQRASLKS